MNENEKLLQLADKMVLLCLNSEIMTHRILGKHIYINEIVTVADRLVNTPISQFYAEIIEELRDSEIENLTLEGEEFSPDKLTSNEEWIDMVADLVSQIKSDYLMRDKGYERK